MPEVFEMLDEHAHARSEVELESAHARVGKPSQRRYYYAYAPVEQLFYALVVHLCGVYRQKHAVHFAANKVVYVAVEVFHAAANVCEISAVHRRFLNGADYFYLQRACHVVGEYGYGVRAFAPYRRRQKVGVIVQFFCRTHNSSHKLGGNVREKT